jgi:GPH family glycoside/pentoside/hexuronide:cation symporter
LSDWGLFLYLTATYLLTYTFWTVFTIPYTSLGAEMTLDYHERTVLTGVREMFGVAGTIVGTMAPPLFAAIFMDERTGYSYLAGLTGMIAAVLIIISFFNLKENPEFQTQTPIALKVGLKAIFRNRPFRTLFFVYVIALMGGYFVPILTLYMGDYVIKAPKVAPYIIITYLLADVLSIPFWIRLSRRRGKKETWAYAIIHLAIVATASVYYHEGTVVSWFVLAALAGFGAGAALAIVPSMMADVIDLDELETGRRREGAYFGIWAFMDKTAIGLTAFIGFSTLAVMGYKPNVDQTFRVYWAIKFLYSILPAICYAICYFLLRKYPIDQKEHERIRAKIEAKKTGSSK